MEDFGQFQFVKRKKKTFLYTPAPGAELATLSSVAWEREARTKPLRQLASTQFGDENLTTNAYQV